MMIDCLDELNQTSSHDDIVDMMIQSKERWIIRNWEERVVDKNMTSKGNKNTLIIISTIELAFDLYSIQTKSLDNNSCSVLTHVTDFFRSRQTSSIMGLQPCVAIQGWPNRQKRHQKANNSTTNWKHIQPITSQIMATITRICLGVDLYRLLENEVNWRIWIWCMETVTTAMQLRWF